MRERQKFTSIRFYMGKVGTIRTSTTMIGSPGGGRIPEDIEAQEKWTSMRAVKHLDRTG